MKHTRSILALVALALLVPFMSFADDDDYDYATGRKVRFYGNVTAVDMQKNTIKVRADNGTEQQFTLTPYTEIEQETPMGDRNVQFSHIQAGQRVKVKYYNTVMNGVAGNGVSVTPGTPQAPAPSNQIMIDSVTIY